MARSIRVACAWCFLGTLSSTLTSRWFQHLCSPASGYTFRSALQIPRCPSPITSFGAFIPRSLRSRSTADQLSVDSRCPLATVTIVLRPSANPARATSTAAFSCSSPAFQAPHSRAAHGDRSVAQRQVARLAMTVAVARSRVDLLASLRLLASQQFGHFLLEKILQPRLDPLAHQALEAVPRRS